MMTTETAGELPFARWVMRRRVWLFALVVVVHVAAFNGTWRIGRDSALYRGLGHSLATGKGYTFAGELHRLALPGYPLLLAVLERWFGSDAFHPWPQLVVMEALSAVTLAAVYWLIRQFYPPWVATLVTVLVGLNNKFLEQTCELMTDIPSMLMAVGALMAFTWLRRAKGARGRVGAMGVIVVTLGAYATLRPTFWAVAGAWGLACWWALFVGKDRLAHLLALTSLVILTLIFFAVDPRTKGFHPMEGGYENSFRVRLNNFMARMTGSPEKDDPSESGNATKIESMPVKMIHHHVSNAFFGVELWWLTIPLSVLIILYGIMMAKVEPLWGLLVLLASLMFALFGSTPRYFLLIMPILLTAWLLSAIYLGGWLGRKGKMEGKTNCLLMGAVFLVALPNLGMDCELILEQHSVAMEVQGRQVANGTRLIGPFVRGDFLDVYRMGKMRPVVNLSEAIGANVPEGEVVLGDEPHIMTFLSGRDVISIHDRPNAKPGWAIFSDDGSNYKKFDPEGMAFIRRYVADQQDAQGGIYDGEWLAKLAVTRGP